MVIKTWRDPYDEGFSIVNSKEIEIHKGLSVLVGCNGAGKTTTLLNIKEELKKNNIPVHMFDNLREDNSSSIGAMFSGKSLLPGDDMSMGYSLWTASEGEAIKLNIGRQSGLYKEFLKSGYFKDSNYKLGKIFNDNEKEITTNKRVLLFDATDSGVSIDSICELKELFNIILKDATDMGLELYIIISANEYELCRNEQCFDVNSGKYLTFSDYEDYRKFIINSRKRKEKRIEKQIKWQEKQKEKEQLELEKIEKNVKEKTDAILQKASLEKREINYGEKLQIEDLERELKRFKRKCKYI